MSALAIALEAAVTLRIAELQARGGPTDADFDRAREAADVVASQGDVLQFGGKKRGEAARVFNQLAFAVAVMAFVPGGVEVLGHRFRARSQLVRTVVPDWDRAGTGPQCDQSDV